MIARTLHHTKNATFQILVPHPDPNLKGFPTPNGTGFFVSADGYFLTARHVIVNEVDGNFFDLKQVTLMKPEPESRGSQISGLELIEDFRQFDICLLKVDFEKVKNQEFFKGKNGFSFLRIDFRVPLEGSEVYAFGYPLPEIKVNPLGKEAMIGFHFFFPRTTSAIISSFFEVIGPIVVAGKYPNHYVIDKALNYGNSGGPLVLEENGQVISLCSRFQPVKIPQSEGNVMIPSLYGITTSLKNIENFLIKYLRL